MENILDRVLIESGTGVIRGFFRVPYELSEFSPYFEARSFYEKVLEENDQNNIRGAQQELKEVEERQHVKPRLSLFRKMYETPVLNLSKEDGTCLGRYRIEDMQSLIDADRHRSSEDEGFEISIKSEMYPDKIITVDTEDGNMFGSCNIIFEATYCNVFFDEDIYNE